ncbi:MAG: murein biosynthesis integral membrane protein MurJ [Pseudomonadota bacterium]
MALTDTESQYLSDKAEGSDSASEEKAVTRAAGVVGFWTVLSRVLGYVRDMVTALFLGAGFEADAFFVAFRIPNLLRRLFGEGALSAAFIPTYVQTLQMEGIERATLLARKAFTLTAIVLGVVTFFGMGLSAEVVRVIAPGFIESPEKFSLTVSLNRIMFPYIFFVSLLALVSGVLNSMGHFAAPAAAPIILNLSMIGSIVTAAGIFGGSSSYALAYGVLAAGVLQLLMQIPFLEGAGIRIKANFHFRDPLVKRVCLLFLPAAFGGAVYQVNVLVGTILASLLPAGGVSWLYYADRLVELPLGIFAIALGTAALPSMSRQAGRGDLEALSRSVCYALRLIAFFTIPASVGLIILREPIVAVLFQRGLFTSVDTVNTAYALLWYTVGLWAFSGLKVVSQSFFSMKDTRTPVLVSIAAVVVNLVAGLLLMGPMGHGGLALATSVSAAFNVCLLFALLVRRLGVFPSRELASSLVRVIASSSVMAAALYWGRTLGGWRGGFNSIDGIVLCGCVCVGGGSLP